MSSSKYRNGGSYWSDLKTAASTFGQQVSDNVPTK